MLEARDINDDKNVPAFLHLDVWAKEGCRTSLTHKKKYPYVKTDQNYYNWIFSDWYQNRVNGLNGQHLSK